MKIKNEFIPYEQALALKQLGFDEPCIMTYLNGELDKELFLFNHSIRSHSTQEFISAPLYQQAFRWFREKYTLFSHIGKCMGMKAESYFVEINTITEMLGIYDSEEEQVIFKSYSEAEFECLKKLIEICKK